MSDFFEYIWATKFDEHKQLPCLIDNQFAMDKSSTDYNKSTSNETMEQWSIIILASLCTQMVYLFHEKYIVK